MNKQKVANALEEIAEEIRNCSDKVDWPADKMCVPMSTDNMSEEDWEEADKMVFRPPYEGVKFQMPEGENNFSCHTCGGEYGPWIKKDFWYHDYASLSENPSINLGITRIRRCTECGHIHHNSYSMGQVLLEVDEKSGHISLGSVM
jgi:hypothetical protein